MSSELSRRAGAARPAAPVRLIHLGLGDFFRAHQAWYTEHAPDGEEWGFAAFGDGELPALLTAQQGLYTLVTRSASGDRYEVVATLSQACPGTDRDALPRLFGAPEVAAVTLTEVGARDHPDLLADLEALRNGPAAPVRTTGGRLIAGLAARHRADAGPIALVACDHTSGNGAVVSDLLRELGERVDRELTGWLAENVSVVSTVADRVTPRTGPSDARAVAEATGREDRAPVVAEPYAEWVLSGAFPAGRPRWEDAGALLTDDLAPYERRKQWLANGSCSLLAYAGSIREHATAAEAIGDDACLGWLSQWWSEAGPRLGRAATGLDAYCQALLDRLANPRVRHRLARLAADGSRKLPERVLPVVRAERADGRVPEGAALILAAWVCHLRGHGAPVSDPRAAELTVLAAGPLPDGVHRALDALDPELAADEALVAAVCDAATRFDRVRVP
ncbi:mannitol dehydrogenase family protein [Nonomuraea sp. NPDC048826]|uniref:mannitol dehydrogenase family protein n=1 Tax=Nonomuraea sp. NPDC048826 TaxID=3364347 RepID=UPI003717EF0D